MMHNTAHAAVVPDVPFDTPSIRGRETLTRAGAALWRVVTPEGRVIGHLRRLEHPLGTRFRAERLRLSPASAGAAARFITVGEFWSADEAVASLRA